MDHLARCPADRPRRRGPALRDSRDQLRTDVVAIEPRIPIRRILDPFQPPIHCRSQDFRPGHPEQRPDQEPGAEWLQWCDATQSPHAGASQQTQQHRFELVVGMVRRQQRLSRCEECLQRAVPNRARPCLQALPGDRLHGTSQAPVTDAKGRCRSPAATFPGLRIRMQSVIDMQRADLGTRRQAANRRQQDSGVGSTAEGDREVPRRDRQLGQASAETIEKPIHETRGNTERPRAPQPSL